MPINLETLQIQFEIRDNTGEKLKALESMLSGFEAPKVEFHADTSGADEKI